MQANTLTTGQHLQQPQQQQQQQQLLQHGPVAINVNQQRLTYMGPQPGRVSDFILYRN